jgi:hypothetical protein
MVAGKEKLNFLVRPDSIDSLHIFDDRYIDLDQWVVEKARKLIGSDFDLMFLHLPNVDYAGVEHGWMSPKYMQAVRRADRAIAFFLKRLTNLGMMDTTLIIVTADHGGRDFSHTAPLPDNRTVPWIIVGPGVVVGGDLDEVGIHVMDTAATAFWALGIAPPADIDGRLVLEAFQAQSVYPSP